MEKKSSGTRKKNSDRLINKFLTKLRNMKHGSNGSIDSPRPNSEDKPGTSGQQNDDYDHQYKMYHKKITPEDLLLFCEQLEHFLKYVQSIQGLTYHTYDYPSLLQNRLEQDAHRLNSLFREVKDAVNNINRIKSQHKCVKKEKSAVKKHLKKLREDASSNKKHLYGWIMMSEIREMENVVSLHDKVMFTQWENIKNTNKPEVLEILLQDISDKQKALVHLTTLVNRKLSQLQIFKPMTTSNDKTTLITGVRGPTNTNALDNIALSTSINNNIVPPIPTTSNNTDDEKQTNSIAVRRYNGTGTNTRSSNYRRRRHQERQEHHTGGRFGTSSLQDNNGINLPHIPFSVGPSAFQFLGTGSNGAISNHSFATASCSPNTRNVVRNNGNMNNLNNVSSEFQSEMRSVLQALFGSLQQSTPTDITIHNLNTNDNNDNESRDIELYKITTPP